MSDLKEYDRKDELLKSLSVYYRSRLNIKNHGNYKNSIEIIDNSDPEAFIDFPKWYEDKEGNGVVIHSDKLVLDLKLKCIENGLLIAYLRGIEIRDKENNIFPAYIDYTSLIINNTEYIKENKLTCYEEPFIVERRVKNNELLTIHIEWKPFSSMSLYKNKTIENLKEEVKELTETKEELKKIKLENKRIKRELNETSEYNIFKIKKLKKEFKNK